MEPDPSLVMAAYLAQWYAARLRVRWPNVPEESVAVFAAELAHMALPLLRLLADRPASLDEVAELAVLEEAIER